MIGSRRLETRICRDQTRPGIPRRTEAPGRRRHWPSKRQDIGALQRNALLTDAACQTVARYFGDAGAPAQRAAAGVEGASGASTNRTLVQPAPLQRLPRRLAPRRSCATQRSSTTSSSSFSAKTGTRVTIAKDFPPEIEKLGGAPAPVRRALRQRSDPRPGDRPASSRSASSCSPTSRSSVRVLPDHDSARITFHIANLDGFETVSVVFPAFEVGTARLDELARWINGEPHGVPARRPAHAPRRRLTPGLRRRLSAAGPLNCSLCRTASPCRSSGSPTPPTSPPSSTS